VSFCAGFAVKLLVVGGGGREHAIVWSVRRDHPDLHVLAVPGNPGIAAEGAVCESWPLQDVVAFAEAAENAGVTLAVIGPEAPLVAGIADALRARSIPTFGPSRAAARIEGSKVEAKEFMLRHGVPTARFLACESIEEARTAVRRIGVPCVVKADGLAGGKGAYVCHTSAEAARAVHDMMEDRRLGSAGDRVVVEECLSGPELTVLAVTDGERWRILPSARDHKRLLEGDRGPNTGGMGAIAPVPEWDADIRETVEQRIIAPTLRGLADEGRPFVGVLYAGLMLTNDGPTVIEFNCRLGDPEAEAVLPLLDSDVLELMDATARGDLGRAALRIVPRAAHAVVLAAQGYPEQPVTGQTIEGLADGESAGQASSNGDAAALMFHSGTRREDERLVSAGGRVLVVTGVGPAAESARHAALARISTIHFAGMNYRRDIGGTPADLRGREPALSSQPQSGQPRSGRRA
jgi:phosphoribosylamine--glycine ligase